MQTALVQDEALKRANARIEELQAQVGGDEQAQQPESFLDSMREGQQQDQVSVTKDEKIVSLFRLPEWNIAEGRTAAQLRARCAPARGSKTKRRHLENMLEIYA